MNVRSIHGEARLDGKFLAFARQLNLYLNHFPRHEKYALASRIRNTAYEVYDLIIEAQKRYHKKTTLTSLDIAHERLRMQLRLAHELGYFGHHDNASDRSPEAQGRHRYETISRMVDELGRMIGGWIATERAAS